MQNGIWVVSRELFYQVYDTLTLGTRLTWVAFAANALTASYLLV